MKSNSSQSERQVYPGVSARRLIGSEAVDRDGNPIGTITDLVIEPHRGVIAFMILQYRDDLGQPRRFAIPPGGYRLTNDGAVVRIDPATLQRSPGRW